MPLKIRVRPEGKIFAGGAVLKNVSSRPVDLLILSDSPVLRDDYLMNVDRKDDSDISNIYFLLQVVYLFKGKGKPLDSLVIKTVQSFAVLYPSMKGIVDEIIENLQNGNSFKALRIAHKLLAEQQAGKETEKGPSNEAQSTPIPVVAPTMASLGTAGALA
jgi:flagellar biosynthesis regulator FlbT